MEEAQRRVCERYGANFMAACDLVNSGYAAETEGQQPINGLRHTVTDSTTGWYIWCGENYSTDRDFFKPVHTRHLYEGCSQISELLGLPPGYRFLVAEGYVDVWFDSSLLAE
jgi:hypothetical protein